LAVFGEVGLAGEVRPVARGQERLREAVKLGFRRILLPSANLPREGKEFGDAELIGVRRLSDGIEKLF
jgi:DNA repair protein RadA/Sms